MPAWRPWRRYWWRSRSWSGTMSPQWCRQGLCTHSSTWLKRASAASASTAWAGSEEMPNTITRRGTGRADGTRRDASARRSADAPRRDCRRLGRRRRRRAAPATAPAASAAPRPAALSPPRGVAQPVAALGPVGQPVGAVHLVLVEQVGQALGQLVALAQVVVGPRGSGAAARRLRSVQQAGQQAHQPPGQRRLVQRRLARECRRRRAPSGSCARGNAPAARPARRRRCRNRPARPAPASATGRCRCSAPAPPRSPAAPADSGASTPPPARAAPPGGCRAPP